jgi:threonine dehydratase
LAHVGVFADGVAVKTVGELTFKLCRQFVDDVITVNNDQICAAIKDIFEATRSIAEPAGALGVAGAKQYTAQHGLKRKKLVTILSGANISFEKLQFVAERTLLGSGKEALFEVTLPESPGALARLCKQAIAGHNITEFCYRMSHPKIAHIFIGIGISDPADKTAFESKLRDNSYEFCDLSGDDIAKEHIRHMIGGTSRDARDERLYEINFPERPRALSDFLAALGGHHNISLFHYRGQGGDVGKVLIGFEAADTASLQSLLARTGYEYVSVNTPSAQVFLRNGNNS